MAADRSYIKRVELKIEALSEAGVWPSNEPGKIKPNSWRQNFDSFEDVISAALIDIFVYFHDQQVAQILERALRRLFQDFAGNEYSLDTRRNQIKKRLEQTVFVPVLGEYPNPTDSGNYICRFTRQTLELTDSHIMEPEEALHEYLNDTKTIVFLDDMVGTGNQMHSTWNRNFAAQNPSSFSEAYSHINRCCYYVCLACSQKGRSKLSALQGIKLITAHDLKERDRFNAALRRIPDHPEGDLLQSKVEAFLRKYSDRLKLESYMNKNEYSAFGFGNLGLTLGFLHSIPDATLPIYWADGGNSWMPFCKRK